MSLTAAFRPATVGLDIGSSAVKAVALKHNRGGWALTAAAEATMPDGAIEGGVASQPAAVSEAIRQVMGTLRMNRATIAAALSGHSIMIKRLTLPAMSQAELDEAIPWEAEQYIPFDINEVQLDYQVINAGTDAAKTSLDVLLVAAKRDRIDDRAAVIAQAGRQPVVLDIEAFALANAYQMNYPERSDALAALVHIGRSATIVCLLERGEPAFTRDISLGGKLHVDALMREFADIGLDELEATRMIHGQVPDKIDAEQVSSVLRDATSQLVNEIRKTVDFYCATAPVERLSRVVVSGGACDARGLIELMGTEFGAPVDVFDPFRRVTRPKKGIGVDVAGPAYAVAVGLAMRRERDR